jgi:SAM-dependent methyltransferase
MKLTRKLGKLVSPEAYRRAWRRAQRSIFRLPFGPVLAGVDRNRLREIQNRYPDEKYANVDHWLRVNRERVQDLKLHRISPQRVIDLGCGGGYFLFILKRFNHSVLGLDVDQLPLFRELLEVFGVPRIVFEVKPFEPLPDLRQQFDWITAFSIGFDRHRQTGARGRIVMFADSGLCAPYDNAKIGIAMIEMGLCDIAHASRRVPGSKAVARPLWRRVGSTGFKWLSHTVMGIPLSITDTQCGFKLYRREAAHELYEAVFTDGYMFDTEMIMRAGRSKWRLLEFPVIWTTDGDSRYKPLSGQTARNLRELAKLRYRFSPLGRTSIPKREPVTERAFDSRVGTQS